MKSQTANSHYRTMFLRIQPVIGSAIKLTQYPIDLTMSNGAIYLASSGYEFTGIQSATSTSPSVFDFEGIAGMAGIDRDTIASGVFDGARCYLFAAEWNNPIEDHEPIIASILGKTTLIDGKYKIEEMALIDALNQSIGKTYTAQCPKTFGGTEYAGCKKNLAGLTSTGTVTAVSSQYAFTDLSRGEANGYWDYGTIKFTSGQNVNLKPMEIRSFATGVFTVFEAFYYQPEIGDAYIITPGCRKTLADCRDKWNNVINFGGFSYMPTSSAYSERGTR